jgi:predicted DNA-binding transcriptional regulator AlpA
MNTTPPLITIGEKQNASDLKPIWIRLPQVTQCYGISRSKAYQLAKEGKVTSLSLRESSQTKGTRLFNVESLEAFIESFLPSNQSEAERIITR